MGYPGLQTRCLLMCSPLDLERTGLFSLRSLLQGLAVPTCSRCCRLLTKGSQPTQDPATLKCRSLCASELCGELLAGAQQPERPSPGYGAVTHCPSVTSARGCSARGGDRRLNSCRPRVSCWLGMALSCPGVVLQRVSPSPLCVTLSSLLRFSK